MRFRSQRYNQTSYPGLIQTTIRLHNLSSVRWISYVLEQVFKRNLALPQDLVMKLGQWKPGTKCLFHEPSRPHKCQLANHVTCNSPRGALKPCDVLGGQVAYFPCVFFIEKKCLISRHIVVVDIDVQQSSQCGQNLRNKKDQSSRFEEPNNTNWRSKQHKLDAIVTKDKFSYNLQHNTVARRLVDKHVRLAPSFLNLPRSKKCAASCEITYIR